MKPYEALTNAMAVTDIPVLEPGYDRNGIAENYAAQVVERALMGLGYSHTVAKRNSMMASGCARIRFEKSLRRLFHGQ